MAQITPVKPTLAGTLTGAVSAAGGGDSVANPRGNVFIQVVNGGGGSINVTLTPTITNRPADGVFPQMTLAANVVAVAAGASKVIGPIPTAFNDGNGNVPVTYSGVTSVTIAAFEQTP